MKLRIKRLPHDDHFYTIALWPSFIFCLRDDLYSRGGARRFIEIGLMFLNYELYFTHNLHD